MKPRYSTSFRLFAALLIPYVALVSLPGIARAQILAPSLPGETPAPAAAVSMQVAAPQDTEVVQAERPVINPGGVPTLPLEEPVDPDKYICGRGDVFELNFWGRQNFKLRVTVDLEGRTFISKVGYADIVGKTLRQAREIVKAAVLRYFPGLNFDLSLVEPRTFLVHVVENIPHPGLYTARPVERASNVLTRAGGIPPNASKRRISIQHRDGSRTTVDLLFYNLTGDTKYNPYLIDGDVIRVPFEDVAVVIGGAVKRPGRYELIHGKDFAELLDLAGGFATTATRQLPIRLIRKNEQERDSQVDVPIPKDGVPQLVLRADDAVVVPSVTELQRTVLLIGAIAGAVPTDEATHLRRFPFVEKETVRALIERAGGIGAGADLSASYILKTDARQVPIDLEALLVRRDFTADKPVEMGDSVVVPYKRRSVVVEGAVFRPNAYPYNPKFNVLDYVATAGGETRFAQDVRNTKVITPTGKTLDYTDQLKVGPGDTVVVPERNFSRSEVVQLVIGGVGLLLSGAAIYIAAKK
jgi:protein involved in polysaccharide export with SLBB domain